LNIIGVGDIVNIIFPTFMNAVHAVVLDIQDDANHGKIMRLQCLQNSMIAWYGEYYLRKVS
jgi:hypothetical protein